MKMSREAFDLIIAEEVSSKSRYEAKYRAPEWPGVRSGVTIGIGYDVGYATRAQLRRDWSGAIPENMIAALESYCGVTGDAARRGALSLRRIVDVPWAAALAVYEKTIIPRWEATVQKALPNTDKLSGHSFGALVSLAYNRGPAFSAQGDRFREMRAIKSHMASFAFHKIPSEFRSMKRIWPHVPGLQGRREREARLFERGIN